MSCHSHFPGAPLPIAAWKVRSLRYRVQALDSVDSLHQEFCVRIFRCRFMQNRFEVDRVSLQMVRWPAEKGFELKPGRVFWGVTTAGVRIANGRGGTSVRIEQLKRKNAHPGKS